MGSCRSGFLTIFSAEGDEIYGEFADAVWETERSGEGVNHVMSGTASEGTLETFRRLDTERVEHVRYSFESGGVRYVGSAQILRPSDTGRPGGGTVRIESGEDPVAE